MSKRLLSHVGDIPPAHRHCQRPAAVASPVYTPSYIPTSPYTGPIGSPPRYWSLSPPYDGCPPYSPTKPAYNPVRKYHHMDVMSPTYDVDYDPLRFAPINPSKITTWTWPEFPKATRPQPPLPEFDDDVECSEVADVCDRSLSEDRYNGWWI